MKRDDISEEIIYVFKCPFCSHYNDQSEDPDYVDYYTCQNCYKEIELED